jgi:hypothetical protein
MEEKELFEDYEQKVWEFTPRLKKIIASAVILNFVGLFAIGQFDILQTKGCDTPFVGIVCQALDSAYVASVFMGKDLSADSTPYPKTEIGDDQEVTFIDVSNQLTYPDGYFALANPPENLDVLPTDTQVLPNFNSSDNGDSFGNTPSPKSDKDMGAAVLPPKNNSVGKQDSEELPYRVGGDDRKPSYKTPSVVRNTPKTKPTKTPKLSNGSPTTLPGDDVVAKVTPPKPTPSATPTPDAEGSKQEFNDKFNRKPLQDFGEIVVAKVDSNDPKLKVDLKQNFTVVLDGTLTAEGKFDAKATKFLKGEGNEQMVNVAKDAIEAMGDSKLFSYLKVLGVDRLNITLVQDDKKISAIIKSSQPNEERARTISSGFNGIIAIANMNTKDDKEIQTLLKSTKFKAEGKSFVINFEMPKDQAHQLIEQKLGETRQKKSQPSNGEGTKEATAKTK